MNGRKAIVGLCLLCALLLSAIAVQSASAIKGTTAVTCKKGGGDTGGATFNEAHCKPSSPSGEWGHYKIAENTTTELTGNNNGEPEKLKATIGGVAVTFTAAGAEGTGWIENKVDEDGEHYAHGRGTVVFTGITVAPFTKCFVYEDTAGGAVGTKGVIKTQELTATTKGQGDSLKLTPASGEVFKRFWILDQNKNGAGGECTIPGTYVCSGSVIGVPDGATGKTTHLGVTTQNTLKLGTGEPTIKAGIEGSVTLEGRANAGDTYKPVSVTTYET
ncbi:MAG TPA: hypothetical protein VMS60_07125 [Solirubrobacterales bacterium]|nr:hypothetical protein [Solirubrobacterales bacterium]